MGMVGSLIRVSENELNSFLANPKLLEDKIYNDDLYEAEWCIDIDKAWDGINFILTGDIVGGLEREPNAKERAFFSFQLIDEEQDLGYGPAQYLNPNQVKETAYELQKISEADVIAKMDTNIMSQLGIYPDIWHDAFAQEFLIESFNDLKAFYKTASQNSEAIITFLN